MTSKPDLSAAARGRVVKIVKKALRAAAPQLESESVAHRTPLGLWQAAMGELLMSMEPEDVISLLEDRSKGLPKFGPNAGAPLEVIAEDQVAERRRQILAAAEILSTHLLGAYQESEQAGLEHLFAECVLDQTLQFLDGEWGPYHVRRALHEQVNLITSGQGAVADILEPVQSAAVERADKPPGSSAAASRHRPRAVVGRIEADTAGVMPHWAYAMRSTAADGSRFEEIREATAPVPGANMARATLAAAAAALEAIYSDGSGAHVVMETTNAHLLTGIASELSRSVSDLAVWARLDALSKMMEIDWRRIPLREGEELSVRCIRMLRGAAKPAGAAAP